MSHSRDYSRDLSNQTLDSNNVLMIEVDSKGDMRPQSFKKKSKHIKASSSNYPKGKSPPRPTA